MYGTENNIRRKTSVKSIFKQALGLILVLIMTCGVFGCTSPSDTTTAQESTEPASGSTEATAASDVRTDLNFGLTGDPQSLDPSKTTDQMSKAIWYQMYDTCIMRDNDGNHYPGLAESWEISEDGKTVILHIRQGVKFHDGSDLTAADIVFSLGLLCDSPQTTSKMVSMSAENIFADDDYTVRIELASPFGAILDVLSCDTRIVCKSAYESMGAEEFNKSPVGSGPYKFVERKTGEKIVLEANEDYWRGAPTIKKITFKIMTDSNTAVLALEKGELDFLSHAPLIARQELMDTDGINWYETDLAGNIYIVFNEDSEIFSNPLVREAIAYAVDKEEMVIGAVEGNGTPQSTMVPPSDAGYIDGFPGIPHDEEKAKELLAEAGYPDGFSFKTITQENATYQKPAEVLQGQLRKVGINMEIEVLERGTFNDQMHASNFDMLVGHWTTPIPDGYFLIYTLAHSSNIGNQNFSRINDPELDAQLDIIKTSVDEAERTAAFRRADEIIQENTYFVPLYTFKAACAANEKLMGVQADPVYKFQVYDYYWAE